MTRSVTSVEPALRASLTDELARALTRHAPVSSVPGPPASEYDPVAHWPAEAYRDAEEIVASLCRLVENPTAKDHALAVEAFDRLWSRLMGIESGPGHLRVDLGDAEFVHVFTDRAERLLLNVLGGFGNPARGAWFSLDESGRACVTRAPSTRDHERRSLEGLSPLLDALLGRASQVLGPYAGFGAPVLVRGPLVMGADDDELIGLISV